MLVILFGISKRMQEAVEKLNVYVNNTLKIYKNLLRERRKADYWNADERVDIPLMTKVTSP